MNKLTSISIDPKIPCGELWDNLTIDERDKVRQRINALQFVASARNKGQAKEQAALMLGVSESWVRNKYPVWMKSGQDWRLLIDGRVAALRGTSYDGIKSPEFINYWHELVYSFQRKVSPAYKELCRRWLAGEHIPGYDGVYDRRVLPLGWSDPNLRRIAPNKRERALVTQGITAPYALMPQVFKTRAGAWPMAMVSFDDVWMDHYVHYCGQTARPLQLGCNDYFTGMRLRWGMKPRIKQDNGHYMGLGKLDMLLLTADLLYNVGYSARGTVFNVENGTATFNDQEIALIERITRGHVRVHKTGMQGKTQLHSYGYEGRGKGNPRGKAELESWHNPQHNLLSYMIAPTGHGRDEPESTWGIVKAEEKLLKQLENVNEIVKQEVMHHLPSFMDYWRAVDKVVWMMNSRKWHAIEGWEDCGFMVSQVRLSDAAEPIALNEMKPELMPVVNHLLETSPHLITTRRMSPQEAWDYSLAQPGNELIRISGADVCDMLAGLLAKPLSKTPGSTFTVRNKHEFGDYDLMYEFCVQLPNGIEKELNPNENYLGFVNPFDISRLFVLTPDLRFIGTAPLQQRAPIIDEDAIKRASGRANQRKVRIMAPVRNVVRKRDARKGMVNSHNAEILSRPESYKPVPKKRLPDNYGPSTF